MSEQKSTLIRLGGLWENHGKRGRYFSGRFGDIRVYVFENRERRGEKSPTHTICIGMAEDKEEQRTARTGSTSDDREEDLAF